MSRGSSERRARAGSSGVVSDPDLFAVAFSRAADQAAMAFGYRRLDAAEIATWMTRLPEATRSWIGRGFRERIVVQGAEDSTFTLTGAVGKGPYAWFSRDRRPGTPSPNWEYFFQVAEFVRTRLALDGSYDVGFEDGLMDVSVRREGRLLWYTEVKTSRSQIQVLLAKLALLGDVGVPDAQPDRGNDALRKAKYLVRHRPPHLTLVGGEVRRRHDHPDPQHRHQYDDEGHERLPPDYVGADGWPTLGDVIVEAFEWWQRNDSGSGP